MPREVRVSLETLEMQVFPGQLDCSAQLAHQAYLEILVQPEQQVVPVCKAHRANRGLKEVLVVKVRLDHKVSSVVLVKQVLLAPLVFREILVHREPRVAQDRLVNREHQETLETLDWPDLRVLLDQQDCLDSLEPLALQAALVELAQQVN